MLALGRSWRVRFAHRDWVQEVREGRKPIIYACCHGLLLPLVYGHRGRGITMLVSESRDGEIIARIARKLGFECVRGSTSRGGARSVLEMVRVGKRGLDLAITPDGPRGPRGRVQRGIALIAARSGLPIVPVAAAASRGWNARNWDRFLVPWPGARVAIVYGRPIVPPGFSGGAKLGEEIREQILDDLIQRTEMALADAEREAGELVRGSVSGEMWSKGPA